MINEQETTFEKNSVNVTCGGKFRVKLWTLGAPYTKLRLIVSETDAKNKSIWDPIRGSETELLADMDQQTQAKIAKLIAGMLYPLWAKGHDINGVVISLAKTTPEWYAGRIATAEALGNKVSISDPEALLQLLDARTTGVEPW